MERLLYQLLFCCDEITFPKAVYKRKFILGNTPRVRFHGGGRGMIAVFQNKKIRDHISISRAEANKNFKGVSYKPSGPIQEDALPPIKFP